MQDLSPDMEDLLRKASEAYPLKDTEDRWDEIASGIISAPAAQTEKQKKTGYRKYLASLLLLFLFLFLGLFFFNKTGGDKSSILGDRSSTAVNNRTLQKQTKDANQQEFDFSKPIPDPGKKKQGEEQSGAGDPGKKEEPSIMSIMQNTGQGFVAIKKTDNDITNIHSQYSVSEDGPENALPRQNQLVDRLVLSFQPPEFSLRPKTFSFEKDMPATSQKKNSRYSSKGFYYGFIAGPGFNSIKSQQLKKAGWSIGLIGGYSFSKKISVETGALFSQKYYTTSGDYFSMKEIGPSMPSAMKVMEVDGYSKTIEIPFSVRYSLFQNRKRNIFSSAGFSSYLLTKEDNQYHTSLNGTDQMMYGTYNNNKRYFAASIDLGIGYVQNFGNKNSIRFQPYLQIPVKGIGVGDLQIMGAGLRAALTHRAR